MMAKSQDAMAKRDKKKHREKEASAVIYIDLTKQAIEVQRLDAEAKSRAEDNLIMLADLNTMDANQSTWIFCLQFEKGTLERSH
ncbi:hypothetical protein QYE76_047245 [Lolium multiflorum]|uniref:Uncharacterized protein n=1 Tax=Lolium multiflorum TaxID=4521 RepID=A0AAD8TRD8_LOLMU|nr:hypothetical protein QYE76_047245 [Lolium multiflorum]